MISKRISMEEVMVNGLPKGYAYAYREYNLCSYVLFPFPLNHIVKWFRLIWLAIRDANPDFYEEAFERRLSEAKNNARKLGYERGFEAGKKAKFEEMMQNIDAYLASRRGLNVKDD